MNRFTTHLSRGLLLRCPVCGKGHLFQRLFSFKMNDRCPVCGLVYEREPGYFSSAMAINLVVSELLITILIVPLSFNLTRPIWETIAWCAPLPFLLPVLLYKHSRSLWLSMNHYLNPIQFDRL